MVHTITADKAKRVRLLDAKPNQVFDYAANADGSFLLTPVKKAEPEPTKFRIVKNELGYRVIQTDKVVSEETIKEILNEP